MRFMAIVAFCLVAIFAIVQAIRFGRTPKTDDEAPTARIVFEEVVDPDQLRAALAEHRASGDWRGAVIAGFRLAVLALIDDEIAAERPGATTGDFGRAVARNRPKLSPTYNGAGAAFERAFYSDDAIGVDDYAAVQALLDRLARVSAES